MITGLDNIGDRRYGPGKEPKLLPGPGVLPGISGRGVGLPPAQDSGLLY